MRRRIFLVLLAIGIGAIFFSYRGTAKPLLPFQQASIEQLTTNSKASLAALSPDGKLFVYTSRNRGLEALLLGYVEGGEPKELQPPADVSYRSLRFSPDGSSIYYNLNGGEEPAGSLFKIPTFGGVPEKLRANLNARIAFSPDFSRIAYISRNADQKTSTLVVGDTDGSNELEIASRDENLPFRSFSPSWSADATKIAVGAEVEDKSETYDVFVVSVEDGRMQQLTSFAWNEVLATIWLPDGSGLIVVARETSAWNNAQLWRVSYPEGIVSRVVSDLDSYDAATISLSSDGRSLLAIQLQRISSIWVAPADDLNQAKQIIAGAIGDQVGNSCLDWAPDGAVYYGASVKGSMTIWRMEANGGDRKQLTSAGHVDTYVRATGDGRYLVFQSNRTGGWEIWRANADGGNMKQLTEGGSNKEPTVTPDGRHVVYTSLRNGVRTLWRVSIDGGQPVPLSDRPAFWP